MKIVTAIGIATAVTLLAMPLRRNVSMIIDVDVMHEPSHEGPSFVFHQLTKHTGQSEISLEHSTDRSHLFFIV